MNYKHWLLSLIVAFSAQVSAEAENYQIDTKGAHAFVSFKVNHLGYSWLRGRFDNFDGTFAYDETSNTLSNVNIVIQTESVNSNHVARDRHLRSDDFLDVKEYPEAMFKSTSYKPSNKKEGILVGDLTLHGVTRSIEIPVEHIGGGSDPWDGYRQGFSGTVVLTLADYGIKKNLGPNSKEAYMTLEVEGIRSK